MAVPARAQHLIPRFDSETEKERIMKQFDMAEIEKMAIFGARLLVAKWIRQNEGSIKLIEKTQKEDNYQSKVGLVIKVGPLAFTDDNTHDWAGLSAKVGDWVMYSNSDGHDFEYRVPDSYDKIPCKILEEGHVQMVMARPDFAF